ncbi:type II CAAX endopeptidase family protein [Senegalia massiliensis]|uniref:type II CAAX endopeptidase family protein n=1 Tax=Senegalia massiliensis TaxID=1720316 RepID=UPI0010310F8F|nr:type II CAAX endopeptidase family protein [Senegalia massiliensis]
MEKINRPKILETNIFYLIIAVLLLTIGGMAQSYDLFSGLIITEYILILLPVIIYLKIKNYNIKEVLRLNKIKVKDGLLIILITILIYPLGAFFNSIMLILISLFSELKPNPIPTPTSSSFYLLGLFIIAVTPGICEEVMFRGFMMKSYEGKGYKKAIFISALLFGVFHFNIQNLLGPMFLGVVFGFIVYKTNSLVSGIIAHTTNNAVAWSLTYLLGNIDAVTESAGGVSPNVSETTALLASSFLLLGISFFSGAIALFLYKKLSINKKVEIENFEENNLEEKGFFQYIPIIITFVGFIILNILAYK